MNYAHIFKSNYKLIIAVILVTAILVMGVTALSTFKYKATTKILVIQKQVASLDAYTATKSAERISKSLAEIIYTSSFYDNVIDSNLNLKKQFSADEFNRRKEWKKDIETLVYPESGILEIAAYNADPEYARQLVRSIAYTLVNKGGEYHGGGRDVEIKIVDTVLVSKYPVRPNVFLNLALAILIGFVLANIYILIKNRGTKLQLPLKLEQPVVQKKAIKSYSLVQPQTVVEPIKITTVYDHLEKAA